MTQRALSQAQFEECTTCGLDTEMSPPDNAVGFATRHHVGESHQQGLNYDDDHDPVLRQR